MHGHGPDGEMPQRGEQSVSRPPDAALGPGSRLGEFTILSGLATDGSRHVFLAHDAVRGGTVTLNAVPAHDPADRGFRARFMSQARRLAALDRGHPTVLPLIAYGEHAGWLYAATRHVAGSDLGQYLALRGALAVDAALRLLRPVADALDDVHRRGLVHGAVRPSSILLSEDGPVYLTDFALGRSRPAATPGLLPHAIGFGDTPAYAAPEQIEGQPVDHRTDVYSLGCVLYECLTGRPPFVGPDDEVLLGHLRHPPGRPSDARPDIPHAVDEVVATALAKRPEDRYPSATALIDTFAAAALPGAAAVRAAAQRPRAGPDEEPRGWPVALVGAGLALAAVLALVGMTFAAGFWNVAPSLGPQPSATQVPRSTPAVQPTERPLPSPTPAVSPTARPTQPPAPPPAALSPGPTPGAGLPTLSVADARIVADGGDDTLEFSISLSWATDVPVTVEYETANGTAVAGIDYDAARGTVRIVPPETVVVVPVRVRPGTPDEADETLSLRILSATNAIMSGSSATGTIAARPINRAPVCQPLARQAKAGGSTTIDPSCSDPDGDVLRYEIASQPERGRAQAAGGMLRYEAATGALGSDSFAYIATDGQLESEPATVAISLSIGPQRNRAPSCEALTLVVPVGGSEVVRPRCSDPNADRLTFSIAAPPSEGTAEVTDNGRIRFVANPGATGQDTFTYFASDGSLRSAPATVTVTLGTP